MSALLYVVSLMVASLWYCSLFFLVPLYYASLKCTIKVWHGFVWGLIVYSFLFSFLVSVLLEYAQGKGRLICFPFFVLYGACSSALWFYSVTMWKTKPIYAWLITSVIYFWWVDTKMLIICGLYEGVPFFFPLLPLASRITMLWSLSILSKYVLFLIISLNSMLNALWLSTFRSSYICSVIALYFLFF